MCYVCVCVCVCVLLMLKQKAWPPVNLSCSLFSVCAHTKHCHASLSQVSRSHIHKHIHIHINTFIHTHIHIYTHTYTCTIGSHIHITSSHWCLALTGVSLSQGTAAAHSHYVSLSQNSAAVHNLFPQGTAAGLALVCTSLLRFRRPHGKMSSG